MSLEEKKKAITLAVIKDKIFVAATLTDGYAILVEVGKEGTDDHIAIFGGVSFPGGLSIAKTFGGKQGLPLKLNEENAINLIYSQLP